MTRCSLSLDVNLLSVISECESVISYCHSVVTNCESIISKYEFVIVINVSVISYNFKFGICYNML